MTSACGIRTLVRSSADCSARRVLLDVSSSSAAATCCKLRRHANDCDELQNTVQRTVLFSLCIRRSTPAVPDSSPDLLPISACRAHDIGWLTALHLQKHASALHLSRACVAGCVSICILSPVMLVWIKFSDWLAARMHRWVQRGSTALHTEMLMQYVLVLLVLHCNNDPYTLLWPVSMPCSDGSCRPCSPCLVRS